MKTSIFASRKGLIAILGAAAITIGAVGSYGVTAYFSDNETVTTAPTEGAVAGTFDLSNQTANAKLFDNLNLAPGLGESVSKPIVLKNNGSLDLVIKPSLNFSVDSPHFQNASELQYSEVRVSILKFGKDGKPLTVGAAAYNSLPSALAALSSPSGLLTTEAQRTIKPGEWFEVQVSYRINPQAGNEYQGLKVGATLTVDAFQTNDPARN